MIDFVHACCHLVKPSITFDDINTVHRHLEKFYEKCNKVYTTKILTSLFLPVLSKFVYSSTPVLTLISASSTIVQLPFILQAFVDSSETTRIPILGKEPLPRTSFPPLEKSFQTMVNNHQSIAPAPSPEYTELLRRLTAIEESLKTMDSNIGIVIKGNKDSLEILDSIANASGERLAVIAPTTISAFASTFFGIPSATPSVAPSVGPVVLTGANTGKLSKQDRTRVLLMHDLHAYLAPKVVGTSVQKHFDCCKLTYHTFKTEIDVKVGKSCNRLLQKEAMSEGKSKDNMPEVLSNCAICTYNHFLMVVDDFIRNHMDFNLCQMLKRSFGRDAVLAVLARLTSLLPHWDFRDEFQ
ncbi:hypothetical protein PHYBLDRAFT_139367 [Phycomyces blakesleeanus NRRL 1555(-)]|uniref:Uncharacterized protein n=1 Tax=Phycomyces blakesleeanus (strain ATCC 8743b / DSM 1359 / FGSC 10004 / NBRC 33097 / NRRL 1555) TaxID=763407 RepID=A0A162YA73_PHYB8|nr:hypothetical protein PHYBLDRAFT_139367 [Phycomyces blakesleeanus NRRL 1555(-)]OAD79335.1 hypothetical protein PHYBLDRAFT_139367 [Phycomyces blakesleeanus NRRL 1555(-)]|eukprot:XP_018297375.1 hypothetical protein PHYBLDRAFT_139367 [Phycomyces blakesleeanus NRRL 1555(-)]